MKIVVSTGGSGGHIFPALQTALVLKKSNHHIVFVGSLGVGQEKVRNQGFDFINISAQGLSKKSIFGILKFLWITFLAVGKSLAVLKDVRPEKVIGFGGYGSFSVVLAAWFLRIPVMIHEQNVYPGKANRILARFVKKIAISFKETLTYVPQDKAVWTGCPCLSENSHLSKDALYQKFNLDPTKKTILVLGGSQGSQKINSVVHEMIALIQEAVSFQFIVMTGKNEFITYLAKYKNVTIPVRVFEFISPIEDAYAICDLVIARSGAATVCELGHFVIPSILIPYPLADGHQKFNAQVLFDVGFAQIIEQSELTADLLRVNVDSMLNCKFDQEQVRLKLKNIFKDDSAKYLARAVEEL